MALPMCEMRSCPIDVAAGHVFRTAHPAFWHHSGDGYRSFPSLLCAHPLCYKTAVCISLVARIPEGYNCANFSGRYISTGDEEEGDDDDADEEEEEVDEEEEEEEGEGEAGDKEAPVNGELKLPQSLLELVATAAK